MNYKESVAYIESLSPTLEKPSLDRIRAFMATHDNFQNDIATFHIGGTNGKGSTAVILDSILSALGVKTGRFTGPHILRFNERINVAGKPIDDSSFARIATLVKEESDRFARANSLGPLTWFEFLTVMAFFKFREEGIQCAILEVGLGGRFDATNVVDNVLGTIITNINLDHTHILGSTVEQIAFEKAGIMKPGIPVVTSSDQPEAVCELRRQAGRKKTRLIELSSRNCSDSQSRLGELLSSIEVDLLASLSLLGPHQKLNCANVIECLRHVSSFDDRISDQTAPDLIEAVGSIYFPGRLQSVDDQLILDGAHNPSAAKALRAALAGTSGTTFILGFYKNKDVEEFLRNLLKPGDRVIACQMTTRRKTYTPQQVQILTKKLGIACQTAGSVMRALEKARQSARKGELIVMAGSFAVLKEYMQKTGCASVEALPARSGLSNIKPVECKSAIS